MAVSLRCPNCGENLGKDTENPRKASCDNCGETNINNPRGYTKEDEERWQKEWEEKQKAKKA